MNNGTVLPRDQFNKWVAEIRNYYASNAPHLPPDYHRRYFKFVWKYPRQTALHVRDRVKDAKHLQALAVKFAPQHIYYSLTTWLDPTTVRGRKNLSIPLWSDLVFDVDSDNLQHAKTETLKLLKYLRDAGYKDLRVLFTGHKGFHVYVRDFSYEKYPEDPVERGKYFEKVKKKIIEEVLSEGIEVDPNLWDLYRVVRVPNTLNATTMLPAMWVQPGRLKGFNIRVVRKYPCRPVRVFAHTLLISSHVMGTPDRHVLFLDYDNMDYNAVREEVERIIEKYSLSTAYLFKTVKGYNVWFIDALPLKRILRIKADTSDDPMHAAHIYRYGYDVARVWKKVLDDGTEYPEPAFAGIVPSDNTKYPLSRGHALYLLNRYKAPVVGYKFIGSPTVKVFLASAPVRFKARTRTYPVNDTNKNNLST